MGQFRLFGFGLGTIMTPGSQGDRLARTRRLIFMVFFLPLSLYFFYLATLNRAPRAVMVSGVWDVVGVLAALSGFLLIGGPSILSGLYEQWRLSWLLGNFHRLRELRGDWNDWIMLYAAYFVAVVVFGVWFVLQAGSRTSIYNVETREFESLLRRALEESSVVWMRQRPRMLVLHGAGVARPVHNSAGPSGNVAEESAATRSSIGSVASSPQAILAWRPFPSMRHVTLTWHNVDGHIREEVETRLNDLLQLVPSPDNPAAGWLFTSASALLLFSLLTLGALIALRLLRLSS